MEILPNHQRDLDFFERSFVVRLLLRLYENYLVSVKLNRRVDKVTLSNALKLIVFRNPIFGVNAFRVEGTEENDRALKYKNFVVRPVSSIAFEDVVSYHEGTIDHETLLDISSQLCPVNIDLPMWRIRVYENNECQYISFINNHILFDGQSSAHFFEELVEVLAELEGKSLSHQQDLFDYEKDKHVLPALKKPLSAITDVYVGSWYQRIAVVLSEILPYSITSYWNLFYSFMPDVFKYPVQFSERKTREEYKSFVYRVSPEQADKLVALCRKSNTTLTPLLNVISKYCLQETFLKPRVDSRLSIGSCVPLSARRYYPELHEDLKYSICVFASYPILEPIQDSSPENLLLLLKKVAKCINTDLKTKYVLKKIEFFKWIDLYGFYHPDEPTVKDKDTFEVSNIGPLKAKSGNWEAVDAIFSLCIGVKCPFKYCVVSTPKGGLNIGGSFVSALDTELSPSELNRINQLLEGGTLVPGSVYSEAHEGLFRQVISQLAS